MKGETLPFHAWVLVLAALVVAGAVIGASRHLGRRLKERTDALTQQALALTRHETVLNRNTVEVVALRQLFESLAPERAYAPEVLQAESPGAQSTELELVRPQSFPPSGVTLENILNSLPPPKREEFLGMVERVRERVNDPNEPTLGRPESRELMPAGAPAS